MKQGREGDGKENGGADPSALDPPLKVSTCEVRADGQLSADRQMNFRMVQKQPQLSYSWEGV